MSRPLASFLAKRAPFDVLPSELCRRLAEVSTLREVPRKAVIWEVGDEVSALHVVQRGVVRQARPLGASREGPPSFHGRGAVIGDRAVLRAIVHRQRREDRATALDDVSVWAIPLEHVAVAAQVHAPFGLALGGLAARHAERLERRLVAVLHRSALARLAELVLELADDFGVWDARGVIVDVKLPQRELAAMVGLSRETVSLGLQELRQRGLVDASGRRLVVTDEAGLRAVGEQG